MPLTRFLTAQASVYNTVLAELRAGRKQTHWMWFIFPQLSALGRSPTAKFYGLAGLEEAREYLAHEVLGARLVECAGIVNALERRSAHEIFGSPDDLKFRSCVTLFHLADPGEVVFAEALRLFYCGKPDPATLALIGG